MYTEPQIVTTQDLSKRSYVTFYLDTKRIREYNGNSIGLRINPNRATSLDERDKLLKQLRFELHKALDTGCYLIKDNERSIHLNSVLDIKVIKNVVEVLEEALRNKLRVNLSKKYKRNLTVIHNQFISFLTSEERKLELQQIGTTRLNDFLDKFGSSGTYYMNKRRDLGVLFTAAGVLLDKTVTVKATDRRRVKASLHTPYEKEQLKPILEYLKEKHPKVYLCCLLTYGCWLRPHEEARLLTKANIKHGCTEIHLGGDSNKSGRVRVVYIPDYVRAELTDRIAGLKDEDNVFSKQPTAHNEYYFSTQWKRAFNKMLEAGLIRENQTIYSFRHTAAIQAYRRSKDIYLLQKLLGHSNIMVTLKYLRSLGELNSEDLRNAAPTLD